MTGKKLEGSHCFKRKGLMAGPIASAEQGIFWN